MVWIGSDPMAPATLQPQPFKKECKRRHQQPDLNTFSNFGSQNLSKRNQSHQTRRSLFQWFESARIEYFLKLWQLKRVQKESKSPNQKIRFHMVWIGSDPMAPATLQPQPFKKEWKRRHQQPDLNTFSNFGSQNLSNRNQSHQTSRSELKWFESARIEFFFKLWQPKRVQKERKSPNQKIRFDMVWIGSDPMAPATLQPQPFILEWKRRHQQPDLNTFSNFGSQNLSNRNQSHQTRRSELKWFESARFEYFLQALAVETCPKGIKITKAEDQIWHGFNQFWSYGARNPSTATLEEGM